MTHPSEPAFWAGIDWGSQSHQACVLDAAGTVLGEEAFPHSGAGLGQLLDWILGCANGSAAQVRVAIEIPHGPVVEGLLERGFQVHSINPKQLDRFRDRFSPAGAKDDRRDARVLADAVRTDPHCLRELRPLDPAIVELREWSRLADDLTAERNRLVNRVREQLWRYYPQFLELGADLGADSTLALWKLAPTPDAARRVRPSTVAKLLKKHRLRRLQADSVLAILRTAPVPVAPGVVSAATAHVRLLADRLGLLNQQARDADRALADLIAKLSGDDDLAAGQPSEQRDGAILASLPGVGRTILATLLAEASGPLHSRDYQALRCLCGVAPVTQRSGKAHRVIRRRASQPRLVNATYHWSRVAVQHDPISRAKYRALRGRGHSHGRALRSVADRLLAIACAMLRSGSLFDPQRSAAD